MKKLILLLLLIPLFIDFKGKKSEIKADQINFFYRGSSLPNDLIILSAKFKGLPDKKNAIEKRQNILIEKKKKKSAK